MSDLVVETAAAVCTVTMSRPERRNALTGTMLAELVDICGRIAADPALRVVVFRGVGRDFSVGMDLRDPELAALAQAPIGDRRRALRVGPAMVHAVQSLPQTTIAALHGYCLGGASCLALGCDLRVVATDLRFGMPEVLRGMNMSWNTVPLLVATIGVTRAKELLLTGAHVTAERAIGWGLANRMVEGSAAEAHDTARAWADEIAARVPPLAATMIKETINAVANASTPMVHMDIDQYLLTQYTEDFAESVSAFMGKREPGFKGQ